MNNGDDLQGVVDEVKMFLDTFIAQYAHFNLPLSLLDRIRQLHHKVAAQASPIKECGNG